MTQTTNRFYDRFSQLMNDAAGVAQGVRREATTMFRGQAERLVTDMDLVRREDFDAVKEMARLAREENTKLEARIADLEAQLTGKSAAPAKTSSAAAAKKAAPTTRPRAARSGAGAARKPTTRKTS